MAETKGVEPVMRPILDAIDNAKLCLSYSGHDVFRSRESPEAVLATLIYSLPPVIRLTNLGL